MKTIENLIPYHKTTHLHDLFPNPEEVLFFDIETTGLSPKGASVYLIGCAFFTEQGWMCRQYFADTPDEESDILQQFCSFAANFSAFWNFNGTTFDIPFLQAKCKKHNIPPFDPAENHDMYRMIRPFKNLLHLSGCRQKQLEEYIGLFREDKFNGGELIDLYHLYGENRDENLLQVLLLHNFEDIQGMLELSSIVSIPLLFSSYEFVPADAALQSVIDARGNEKKEFQITLQLQAALPVPLACHSNDLGIGSIFFAGRDKKVMIKIPVTSCELKYFYKDFKNYSYLPEEDQVIHKSVAAYVDKSRRMPATAANCYTRKQGDFVPAFKGFSTPLPLFRTEHKSNNAFLLPDASLLQDQEALHAYVQSVLKCIVTSNK